MEFTHAIKRAPVRKLAELMGLSRLIVPEQLAKYRTSEDTSELWDCWNVACSHIWRPKLLSRVGERVAANVLMLSGKKGALLQDAILRND